MTGTSVLSYESDPNNLSGTAVSQVDIEKALSRTRARKKIWIADACHSGFTVPGTVRGNQAYLTNKLLLEIASSSAGLAVFSSTSASEYSQEDKRWGTGHGVFTYHLLEGLKGKSDKDKDGLITLRELYEYVYDKVVEDTKGQQHPILGGTFDNRLPLGIVR